MIVVMYKIIRYEMGSYLAFVAPVIDAGWYGNYMAPPPSPRLSYWQSVAPCF